MPRLKDVSPKPVVEHKQAWWCHRHGWWIDTDTPETVGNMDAIPECGIDPCGGRQMDGPHKVRIEFTTETVASEDK